MKKFSDFGIKTSVQNFTGDKIKIDRILNREITVHDYKLQDSKYGSNNKCLHIQIAIGESRHVVFTGSMVLIEMIEKVSKSDFPFLTKIIKEDERYVFS